MVGEFDWAGFRFLAVGHRDGHFIRQAGVYAFVRRTGEDRILLFVDQAELIANAAGEFHPRWVDALALGMNELHVYAEPRERIDRLMVLDRVVRRCTPLLNVLAETSAQSRAGEPASYAKSGTAHKNDYTSRL